MFLFSFLGLPCWLSGKEPACRCRRRRFNPWVKKIPWRRKWQPTLVFLPGKSHRQRSLASYSPGDHKESDTTQQLNSNSFLRKVWSLSFLSVIVFYGLKCDVPERYSEVLASGTCQWPHLIWKQSLHRCHRVKMRSSESALTWCESCPSKKDHTQSDEAWEAREDADRDAATNQETPRATGSWAREGRGFLWGFGSRVALTSDFRLGSRETMRFCCVKPPS